MGDFELKIKDYLKLIRDNTIEKNAMEIAMLLNETHLDPMTEEDIYNLDFKDIAAGNLTADEFYLNDDIFHFVNPTLIEDYHIRRMGM